jgi:hypothetical protein
MDSVLSYSFGSDWRSIVKDYTPSEKVPSLDMNITSFHAARKGPKPFGNSPLATPNSMETVGEGLFATKAVSGGVG